MKGSVAAERGGRLLQLSFPRWNSPQLLSRVVAAAVVDGLAGKKQAGPSMKDLTVEDHGGRFLPPSPSQRKNPPQAMPQLFSGCAVDVGGYDHVAFLVESLAANKPLPEKGRFLEAVVQAGPLIRDLIAAKQNGRLLPPPLPLWRNLPPTMPHIFSGGAVGVGYDYATAVVDSLDEKKPLPEKGRFLEAVLQAGPTIKDLMAAELLPPPLPRWTNPPPPMPHLFSGTGVDSLAVRKRLPKRRQLTEAMEQAEPTTKNLTAEEAGGRLLPLPMPHLFSCVVIDAGYDHAAAVVDSLAARQPLPKRGRFMEAVMQAGPTLKYLIAAEHSGHLLPQLPQSRITPPAPPLPQVQVPGGELDRRSGSWFASDHPM